MYDHNIHALQRLLTLSRCDCPALLAVVCIVHQIQLLSNLNFLDIKALEGARKVTVHIALVFWVKLLFIRIFKKHLISGTNLG